MPNHVMSGIQIGNDMTTKQRDILKYWESTLNSEEPVALCRHYLPEINKGDADHKWYEWRLHNWNTKWGCYDIEIDINEGSINFSSAWSCIGMNIIELFSKDFPDFIYHWEEENGWGGEMEYENGEQIMHDEYDEPNFDEEIEYTYKKKTYHLSKLLDEHPNYDGGIGYYCDWWGMEFLGTSLVEAKKYIREESKSE
tara:strand:- start:9918 stop:10508 length:591 start_codon:yes stop_codon:yes gene_type:complete